MRGTNKLQTVSGGTTQYTYDGNGNLISDNLNNLSAFKNDHRNLITEFRRVITIPTDPPSYEIYLTEMKYDDMGMRIRKTEYLYTGNEQEPVFNEDAPIGWTAITDLYYIRDATGKEIAIYNSYDIKQWNLFGFENEGYLNPDGEERIYIKDHLGSIRVTLDDKLAVIHAEDYDMWGYPLEDRKYETAEEVYKFTGKERDKVSGYDYFGARYYNSRIGRWGQVEPLLEKYLNISSYCYGLNNPMVMVDLYGLAPMDVILHGEDKKWAETELNSTSKNIKYSVDDNGKLSYTGVAITDVEKYMVDAIDNQNVITNLYLTDADAVQFEDGIGLILPGLYGGYETINGKKITSQFLNMDFAVIYSRLGGGSVGKSLIHEILESHISANQELTFNESHKKVLELMKDTEVVVKTEHISGRFNENHTFGLINKNTKVESPDMINLKNLNFFK
ncbi:MAG TPA: RHS repeat-associated core domain-containing protein [Ignavibacteria bacterium]|nr:RHS repeat-associated core domain-containing protein [Ignavibacteria bacterium]